MTQPVITIVLEGRTMNFGANSKLIATLPRETKIKTLEAIAKVLFPEIDIPDLKWIPRQ